MCFQMPSAVSQFWMKTEMIGNARSDLELLIWEITNKTNTILNHSSRLNQSQGEISLLGPNSSWLSCKHATSCRDWYRPLIGRNRTRDLNTGLWLVSWWWSWEGWWHHLVSDLWVMSLGRKSGQAREYRLSLTVCWRRMLNTTWW